MLLVFIQGSDIKQLSLLLTSLVQNNRQYLKTSVVTVCFVVRLAVMSDEAVIACYQRVQSAVQLFNLLQILVVTVVTCSTTECQGNLLPIVLLRSKRQTSVLPNW